MLLARVHYVHYSRFGEAPQGPGQQRSREQPWGKSASSQVHPQGEMLCLFQYLRASSVFAVKSYIPSRFYFFFEHFRAKSHQVGVRQAAPPGHVLPLLALSCALSTGEEHAAGSAERVPGPGGEGNLPTFLCLSDTSWHLYARKDVY